MPSIIVEKPAANPAVSIDEMKNFLRVEYDNDDDLITALISGATDVCEAFCMRSFMQKGYLMALDCFPYYSDSAAGQCSLPASYSSLPRYSVNVWNYSQMIKLWRPPLVSVDRITYLSAGDSQWHDLVAAPPLWYPGTKYALNATVMDNNVNVQKCVTPGTSDANPPVPWNDVLNGTTTEASPDPEGEGTGVVWQNTGKLAPALIGPNVIAGGGGQQFGSFVVDTSAEPARLFPGPPGNWWPSCLYVPRAVQIHYTAGYGTTASTVPNAIRVAIMQTVADCYENRTPVGKEETLPPHVKMLLWPYRVMDMAPTRG